MTFCNCCIGGGDADNNASSSKGGNGAGRGAVRGKRQLMGHEILFTRPKDLESKKGISGSPIKLTANYFALTSVIDWNLFQYRVDFAPDEERTTIKRKLFGTAVKDLLAGYIFDGTVLLTTQRLHPDPMELFVQPMEGGSDQPIRITIR